MIFRHGQQKNDDAYPKIVGSYLREFNHKTWSRFVEKYQDSMQLRNILKRIFVSPNELRLRAGWRLLLQFILLYVLSIGFQYGLAALVPFIPIPQAYLWMLGMATEILAVTLSVFIARVYLDRRNFPSLGLRINTKGVIDFFAGLLIAAIMMGAIFLVEYLFGWIGIQGMIWDFFPEGNYLPLVSMFVLFLMVAWQEELVSRGYQLQNLADGLNMRWAIIISSLVFGLLHYRNPNSTWISSSMIALSGVFFAYSYIATRALWLPIGLHLGWNFFEGPIFGYPVSGVDFGGVAVQYSIGPEIITGGAFGPDGGMILLLGLAIGMTLVFIYADLRDKILGKSISGQSEDNIFGDETVNITRQKENQSHEYEQDMTE